MASAHEQGFHVFISPDHEPVPLRILSVREFRAHMARVRAQTEAHLAGMLERLFTVNPFPGETVCVSITFEDLTEGQDCQARLIIELSQSHRKLYNALLTPAFHSDPPTKIARHAEECLRALASALAQVSKGPLDRPSMRTLMRQWRAQQEQGNQTDP